jgi:hypothetical protein
VLPSVHCLRRAWRAVGKKCWVWAGEASCAASVPSQRCPRHEAQVHEAAQHGALLRAWQGGECSTTDGSGVRCKMRAVGALGRQGWELGESCGTARDLRPHLPLFGAPPPAMHQAQALGTGVPLCVRPGAVLYCAGVLHCNCVALTRGWRSPALQARPQSLRESPSACISLPLPMVRCFLRCFALAVGGLGGVSPRCAGSTHVITRRRALPKTCGLGLGAAPGGTSGRTGAVGEAVGGRGCFWVRICWGCCGVRGKCCAAGGLAGSADGSFRLWRLSKNG